MTPELRAWLSDLLDAVESTDDADDRAYRVTLVSRLRRELWQLPLTEPTELETEEDRP